MFEIGKKVVAISDFEDVRELYPFINYPHRGDIWVVIDIQPHSDERYVLLYFDECQTGLCSVNFAPLEEKGETMIEELTMPSAEPEMSDYPGVEI